jgi:hypothetical protein
MVACGALLALAAAGCATAGSSGSTGASASQSSAPRRGSGNLITETEINSSGVSNAYELIQRLRPAWLRSRGTSSVNGSAGGGDTPVVYMDASQLGDLSTLNSVSIQSIRQIQFLNATDATQRFGTNLTGGAIVITSKR